MKTLADADGATLANYYVYSLADGSLVGVNKAAKECSLEVGATLNADALSGKLGKCVGFIDVNGTALPNKEVHCSGDNDETTLTKLDPSSPCTVTSKASDIGDIFPIVFHDGTVEPATNAGKAVLTRGK